MKKIYYRLTTLDPVIMSASSATINNHLCLDYIPGSAILGVVASKLYNDDKEQENWRRFHSGETQFSSCYSVTTADQSAYVSLPVPASWHHPKGEEAFKKGADGQFTHLTNHASPQFERDAKQYETTQFKQCREGYVGPNGEDVSVNTSVVTKTEINPSLGSAEKSQLFSYSAIQSQQTFVGWILCKEEDEAPIKQALSTNVRIGRSKNSEFGRVNIEFIPELLEFNFVENSQTVTIWCLSDVELIGGNGMPNLNPQLSDLNPSFPEGIELDASRTFIRTHRVSRFNQARGGLDREQYLIQKGSVLVYQLPNTGGDIAIKLHQQATTEGFGVNRQQGLGWVSVNPPWSQHAEFSGNAFFSAQALPNKVSDSQTSSSDTALLSWVKSRLAQEKSKKERAQLVENTVNRIVSAYQSARRFNGIINSNEAGPSKTQMRKVAEVFRQNDADWRKSLFGDEKLKKEKQRHICKASNDELGWGIEWHSDGKLTNFADELKDTFEGSGKVKDTSKAKGESKEKSDSESSKECNSVISPIGDNTILMKEIMERICDYDLSEYRELNKLVNLQAKKQRGNR